MSIDKSRRHLMTAAGAVALCSVAMTAPAAAKPRVIAIVAKKFQFVPNEIHVKRGESVVLQFTAPEVPMGCNFADFNARTDITPGKVSSLALTPDKTGTFTFVCDFFCGSGHEDMMGTLIVT
jgi:cytochrome c oxidase subunit 2